MKATTQSGSVSVGGLERPIIDGHVDVEDVHVKQLLEHQFTLVGEVKRPVNAKGEDGKEEIFTSMPRKQFVTILRLLGVAIAEDTHEDVLVKALAQRAQEVHDTWPTGDGEDTPLPPLKPVTSTFSNPKPERQQRAKR